MSNGKIRRLTTYGPPIQEEGPITRALRKREHEASAQAPGTSDEVTECVTQEDRPKLDAAAQ